MAEHLSALELDLVLTRGALDPARQAHLDACAACRERAGREQSAAEAARSLPGHDAVLARLTAKAEPAGAKVLPWRKRAPVLFAAALAVAASIVFFLSPPKEEESRLKGPVSIELIGAAGEPVTHAKVGDRVELAVGAAGKPWALVLAVDDRGNVEPLWPPGGGSGPAPKGARATLMSLEVTAGSVTLVALFTDQPLEPAQGRGAVLSALRGGKVPETISFPGIPTAITRLEVSR